MEHVAPNPWMILPFAILLGTIALAPLIAGKWWLKYYPVVAFGLAAVTLTYYLFVLRAPGPVLHVAHEYISFIALIGSLYVVSGGIHINVKGESTPMVNVVFLLVGAMLANVLGTTGASMLLIRPWIRMNNYRVTAHHVVFFILIVSNVGGCLTPIGDPPLFMGYLRGVPFWWVAEHCLSMWALAMALLLVIFYAVDLRNFRRAPKSIRDKETSGEEQWRFSGLPNVFFLAVILFAVFQRHTPFLSEGLMIAAALGSYFTTRKEVHKANDFNFHPIQEVAILFVGIFATMLPALDWLGMNAERLLGPTPAPGIFYWGTGTLSAVLDNAPTYLSFLSALGSLVPEDVVAQIQQIILAGGTGMENYGGPAGDRIRETLILLQRYHPDYLAAKSATVDQIKVCYLLADPALNRNLVAISVAAVFFGAATYIGNGPNFMVKSIAEHQKVRTPGFLSYVLTFSLPFLLPVLIVTWLVFFR